VSCTSSSFCVAIGDSGGVFTFRNGTWSTEPSVDTYQGGSAQLFGVSCASPSFCLAIDQEAIQYLTFNGSTWTKPIQMTPPVPGGLQSVSCPSASFCVAVDTENHAFYWRA